MQDVSGAAQPRTADLPAPGTTLGRYTIRRLLGVGGMGAVFAAHDPELDREIAVKLLYDPPSGTAPVARLRREATAMARISDPAVVHVYEVGLLDGRSYVAMELIDGESVREWSRRARRSWREVTGVMLAAGRGLVAAHEAGVVHRDVKPDNILMGRRGRVCVVDFGLAASVVDDEPGPRPARGELQSVPWAGTPPYMSPEQHLGLPVTPASDQFGFCVTFWELLFGQRPFENNFASQISTAPSLALAVLDQCISETRGHSDVPRWLQQALRRGLSTDPAQRWASMAELLAAIQRRAGRASRQRRIGLIGAVSALAIAGVGVAVRARPEAPAPPRFGFDDAARVTFAAGCDQQPAFLPDGRTVIYARPAGRASTLHLLRSPGSADVALGAGSAPAVSPSGRLVALLDRGEVAVRSLADPSAPGRRLGVSTSGPSWLDERRLVVGVGEAVIARPVDGGPDRVLGPIPAGNVVRATAVGSNGRIFVTYRADASTAESIVAELLPSGGMREVRRGVLSTAGLRYRASANRIYFVQAMNSRQHHLFSQPADAAVEPTPLVNDTPPTGGFDVTPDGRRLVFSTCSETAVIEKIDPDGVRTPFTARGAWRDTTPVMLDGGRFIFGSTRTGHLQIWLHDPAAGKRPLTGAQSSYPAVSRDQQTLIYTALDPPALRVRSLRDAFPERSLTEGHVDRMARFSSDGATVLFLRPTEAGLRLYRVPLAGGEATPLLPGGVRLFDASPIDDSLAIVVRQAGRDRLQLVSAAGGEARDLPGAELLEPRLRSIRFARDGRSLLVVDEDHVITEIDRVSGRAQVRWRIDGSDRSGINALETDLDGRALIASLTSLEGDLWIADGSF